MRPILRPGTHVLRRPAGRLQVGLTPETALLLPDAPEVRHSLALLGSAAPLEEHQDRSVLELLAEAGLVVDERAVTTLLTGSDVDRSEAAARCRSLGADAATAPAARAALRLLTVTSGPPVVGHLAARVTDLAASAGIGTARVAARRCGVVIAVGEPARELVDPWARTGTPYVLLRFVEGRAVLGPFVLPGSTACLRCLDAHHTDADPAWPLLVRQHTAASSGDRRDGMPEPVDPLLVDVAAGWLVRDLATYAEGGRPSTWSATLTLPARLEQVDARSWLRHPACGCAWRSPRREVASDTMEA